MFNSYIKFILKLPDGISINIPILSNYNPYQTILNHGKPSLSHYKTIFKPIENHHSPIVQMVFLCFSYGFPRFSHGFCCLPSGLHRPPLPPPPHHWRAPARRGPRRRRPGAWSWEAAPGSRSSPGSCGVYMFKYMYIIMCIYIYISMESMYTYIYIYTVYVYIYIHIVYTSCVCIV